MTATVVPFFKDAAFDPETTHVMGEAFERACLVVRDLGQPELIRDVIAKRIVEIAEPGERDPDKLCVRARKAIGVER